MEKKIILTGGGSAGHVTPNLALLPQLLAEGIEVHYIGTADGIERTILSERKDVTYHIISSGKLRRYFSWKNFTDPFRVMRGLFQARRVMREVKPAAVFSKGGFVSVPVVIAAHGKHIPVVTHESDYTPGLANKINAKFADRICVTFEDTLAHVGAKGVHTGTPIRPELYEGDAARALAFTGLSGEKPVLLVMGGSSGAQRLNEPFFGIGGEINAPGGALRHSAANLLQTHHFLLDAQLSGHERFPPVIAQQISRSNSRAI